MPRSLGGTTLRMMLSTLRDVLVAHFQPRAAGHAHVDDELSRIGAGKIGAAHEMGPSRASNSTTPAKNRSSGESRAAASPACASPSYQFSIALELLVELSLEAAEEALLRFSGVFVLVLAGE